MQTQNIPTHRLKAFHPLDFKIERIDHVNHYNPLRVHRHDYFEIFLFDRGNGHHLIDFEEVPIQDCQVHFVTPGQAHQINRSADSNGYVMLFSSEFYHNNRERSDFLFQFPLFYHKTGNPTIVFPPKEFEACLAIVDNMLQVFQAKAVKKKPYSNPTSVFFYATAWIILSAGSRKQPKNLGENCCSSNFRWKWKNISKHSTRCPNTLNDWP